MRVLPRVGSVFLGAFFLLSIPVSANQRAGTAEAFSAKYPLKDFGVVGELSADNAGTVWVTPFGQLNWTEVHETVLQREGNYWARVGDLDLRLSLDPHVQRVLEKATRVHKGSSVAAVVLEAKTGRVLGMTEYRGNTAESVLDGEWMPTSAVAPAASLFKIVTAVASIESSSLESSDTIKFHGGCRNLLKGNWLRYPRYDRQSISFAQAFASSCNTAFARLAIYDAGLDKLSEVAQRLGFNRPVPSDFLFGNSFVQIPDKITVTTQEVGLLGAGFGISRLSPVHAALMAATFVDGVMVAPYIVDEALDAKGQSRYQGRTRVLDSMFDADVLMRMRTVMRATVTAGTARRDFRRELRRTSADLLGGKTGTLRDFGVRDVLYTWYAGYFPLPDGSPASLAVLVASPQNWLVKASSVAGKVVTGIRVSASQSRISERTRRRTRKP